VDSGYEQANAYLIWRSNVNTSQGFNARLQSNTSQKQQVGARAIAATRAIEDQLAGTELVPEIEDAGLEEDLDEEVLEEDVTAADTKDELSELPSESITGGNAELHEHPAADEPQDRENYGDSERWFVDVDELGSPFEQDASGPLPWIADLPRAARPIVRFAIDANYCVHPLDLADDMYFGVRRALALAVAMHLRQHSVELKAPGDWCEIPAIGSDDELFRLITDDEDATKIDELIRVRTLVRKLRKLVSRKNSKTKGDDQRELGDQVTKLSSLLETFSSEFRDIYEKLQKRGANFKALGLQLPNGDVVQVSALMDVARMGKRATRAAALRLENGKPGSIAGESWDATDWKGFMESQRKKKYRPKDKERDSRK